MNCCPVHWTTWLSALLVPAVAFFGGLIAYRQWRTAQNKLKLDMWDRRMKLYEVVRKYLAAVTAKSAPNAEDLREFLFGTADARWLFTPEVADYLYKQLYLNGENLKLVVSEMEGSGNEELKSRYLKLREWFGKQYEELDRRLDEFMRLGH